MTRPTCGTVHCRDSLNLVTETTQVSGGETRASLNFAKINERCAALGATTVAQRCALLKVSRAQLYRWLSGANDITTRRALDLATRLDLSLADVLAPPKPKPPSHPPPQPRPPAGPKGTS
jgi:hypothetical protein